MAALSDLLPILAAQLPKYADYAVVIRPSLQDSPAQAEQPFDPMVGVYPDEVGKEIILHAGKTAARKSAPNPAIPIGQLVATLKSMEKKCGAFSVEASASTPADGFRCDFPITAIQVLPEQSVCVLQWGDEQPSA